MLVIVSYLHTHLFLWVNHQWPTAPSGDKDSIFCGDLIFWQSVGIPLSDFKWISKNIYYRHSWCDWDFQFLTSLAPVFHKFLSIHTGKCSIVGYTGGRHKYISHNIANLYIKILQKKTSNDFLNTHCNRTNTMR